jgi:hypothetical protein
VSQPVNKDTLEENKYVHSLLVEGGEYQKTPHFRPENIAEGTCALVLSLTGDVNKADSKAIDFGCDTEFMIDLMKDRFGEVHGVDNRNAWSEKS